MTEKKWTLLLFGDDPDGIRQFTLSVRFLRMVGGGLAAFTLVVLTLSALLVVNGASRIRTRQLARENALLTRELQRFQDRVDGLEQTVAGLGEQDRRIRLLAGMDATDEEVLEVGIGGPGLATPEAHSLWSVDSVVSKAAFAVEYDLNALERRALLLTESLAEASDSLMAHWDLLEHTPSILPAPGVLSSRFSTSRFHPIYHQALPHEGVDISAPRGTPILAAAKGTVTQAEWVAGLGYTVEIDHGYGYVTRYGHASRLLVTRGQEVTRGEVIAQVGSTGISTSPHLHYEVRVGGVAVNPMNYVIGSFLP
jgi:murein DD-endopeptidase MepM/ murein hydrolase activator NlpD